MERIDTDLCHQLRTVFGSRRWICVMTGADSAKRFMNQVAQTAGFDPPVDDAERSSSPLIGLAVHGTDPEPGRGFPVVSLDLPSSGDFVTDTLATPSAFRSIPSPVLDQLAEWDPDGDSQVLVPSTMSNAPLAGRPTFGGRHPDWAALEDKLAVLELWDGAGIATAPCEVVDLRDHGALLEAHRRLAGTHGSVWAVDNSKGFHGGAAGTHRVTAADDVAPLAEKLQTDHSRVRVMAFLNGVPCSIHGIVLDDKTVTTRPNEMLVYIDESSSSFRYCRFANHWDPSAEDRAAMAAAATAVGDSLRSQVGFRGVFSLDGVLTANGFRPTELNPRYGMALPFTVPAADGGAVDMFLLDKAIIAGAIRPDARQLGEWLVTALDENRTGGASFPTANSPAEPRTAIVTGRGSDFSLASEDENGEHDGECLATVTWAPVGGDNRLNLRFGAGFPIGPPAAPVALAIARLVDREWDVGLPELTPALAL